MLNARHGKPAFEARWKKEAGASGQWRKSTHATLEAMAAPHKDQSHPHVTLLPMWHATEQEILPSLFSTGFASIARIDSDPGFFGRGIYSAGEAKYSWTVYGKMCAQPALLMNWVAAHSAYPVIHGDMPNLMGRANFENYDAHFIPVRPQDLNNPNETTFLPCASGQPYQYTELVVFNERHCLPRYVVELQSDLLPSPTILPQPNPLPKSSPLPLSPPIQVSFSSKEDGERQLRAAVKKNDYATVDALLKAGIHPDTGLTKNTPLFDSIERSKDDRIFQRLCEAGANIFVKDIRRCIIVERIGIACAWPIEMKRKALQYLSTKNLTLPPLLQAACLGDEVTLNAEILRDQLNVKDYKKNTALHYAAANGHVSLCKRIRLTKPILMKVKNNDVQTAILLAASVGCLASIQWFLSNGGMITKKNQYGKTLLMFAAQGGHLALVDWLHAHGAINVTEKDNSGRTPLMLAAAGGHLSTVKWLYDKGTINVTEKDRDRKTPLMYAAQNGHLSTVEWLYAHGAINVTEKDNSGRTPLMWAAEKGCLGLVEWLYAHGAINVTEKDKDTWYARTPLIWAAIGGHLAIVEWLFNHGAVNITEKDNRRTPLMWAAAGGHLATVEWLYTKGAVNVTEKDSDGKNALMMAAKGGHLDTVKWLYIKGAVNVTEKDSDGKNALMMAAKGGHLDTVKWLYTKGAVNVTEKDSDGITTLMMAAGSGDLATVEWLVAHGAVNISETDEDGNTTIDFAATDAIKEFLSNQIIKKSLPLVSPFNSLSAFFPVAEPAPTPDKSTEKSLVELQPDLLPSPGPLPQSILLPDHSPIQVSFSSTENWERKFREEKEKEDWRSRLRQAVQNNDYPTVDALLKAGIHPDTCLKYNTPLFDSIERSKDDRVFWRLCEADANILLKNYDGATIAERIGIACAWPTEMKRKAFHYLSRKKLSLPLILQAVCLGDEETLNAEILCNKLAVRDTLKNTVLHYAAANNQVHLCHVLHKIDPSLILEENNFILHNTALLLAAHNGHFETLQWLFAQQKLLVEPLFMWQFSEKYNYCKTAFLLAAQEGHLPIVQWLLQNGANLSMRSSVPDNCRGHSKTALLLAAEGGYLVTVQWLLQNGSTICEKSRFCDWTFDDGRAGEYDRMHDHGGKTALLLAAQEGHLSMVQWLLIEGDATLDEKDNHSNTALILAAEKGHLETVQWLLTEADAKLNEKNKYGETALTMLLLHHHDITIVEHLPIFLHYCDNTMVKQLLLRKNASPVVMQSLFDEDIFGSTLKAAQKGHLETVQWLLANGAQLTEKTTDGRTALLVASQQGKLETVQWLLANGALLSEKDSGGHTALLLAAFNGHLTVVQWLLVNGATLTEKDNINMTALLWAAYNDHLTVVQWLLQNGAALAEKNNACQSAMDLATDPATQAFLKDFAEKPSPSPAAASAAPHAAFFQPAPSDAAQAANAAASSSASSIPAFGAGFTKP